MPHPAEVNSEVTVNVTQQTQLIATVVSFEQDFNNVYHYHLQTEFGDGNTVATVQLEDVVEQLIVLKEDK